jgi:hypothetical protein
VIRKLRRFLEPLRRSILPELMGDPETIVVESTVLPVVHPRQVTQSSAFEGAAWVRWGSFSVYGMKLHLICATNRVAISHEIIPANVAEVTPTRELLTEADLRDGITRKVLGVWPTEAKSPNKSWPSAES